MMQDLSLLVGSQSQFHLQRMSLLAGNETVARGGSLAVETRNNVFSECGVYLFAEVLEDSGFLPIEGTIRSWRSVAVLLASKQLGMMSRRARCWTKVRFFPFCCYRCSLKRFSDEIN